jgi:hypothetical protein
MKSATIRLHSFVHDHPLVSFDIHGGTLIFTGDAARLNGHQAFFYGLRGQGWKGWA